MSDTPPPDESPPTEPAEPADPPAAEEPPADGKDWKAEAQRKGKEASSLRTRLRAAEEAAEAAKVAGMTEAEKMLADARKEAAAAATAEVEAKYVPRLRQMVLTSAAQGRLIDPRVAASLVTADLDMDDPGEVAAAIDGIIATYPALAVQADTPAPPSPHQGGTFDQGPRGNVTAKKSMNDLLMESMGMSNGQT